MSEARLGADRTNAIVKRRVERFWSLVDMLVEQKMADGRPPFTEKLSLSDQYHQLVAWRDSGDPRFWGSTPEAQAAKAKLAVLQQRFGQPAPIAQPFGITAPGSAPATLNATEDVMRYSEPMTGGVP